MTSWKMSTVAEQTNDSKIVVKEMLILYTSQKGQLCFTFQMAFNYR